MNNIHLERRTQRGYEFVQDYGDHAVAIIHMRNAQRAKPHEVYRVVHVLAKTLVDKPSLV